MPTEPSGPICLMADDINVTLTDRDGKLLLIEVEIAHVPDTGTECVSQLKSALKLNLGLLLSCEAALHLAKREDGLYLVARSLYPYTVNTTNHLIKAIEDSVSLVDFTKHISNETGLTSKSSTQNLPPRPGRILTL